jgi:thiol-disulfide isomerase/thioredoxin
MRALSFLFVLLWLCTGCTDRSQAGPKTGDTFPQLALMRLDGGESVDLSEYRGKALLVNFWATWCEPCRREMPALEALAAEEKRLAVIGVTVDTDLNLAREFVLKHRLTFARYADPGMASTRPVLVSQALPVTYLIAADGRLLARYLGARDWNAADMRREVEAALR